MKRKKAEELKILDEKELDALEVEPEIVEETPEPEVERVEAEVVMTGVVIANMLNIRSGPSTSFNPIGTLYKGNKIEYVTENEEWLKLTDRVGYVMKQFIQ